MLGFFLVLLAAVRSQTASIVAHGDNVITVERSDDGGITWYTIIPTTNNWQTAVTSSESNINYDTIFKFTIKDNGYIGGFIANINYNGQDYYTTNPLNTGNFEFISSSDNNLNLVYSAKTSGPWNRQTVGINNNAFWVWNSNTFNTMVFEFKFSDIFCPGVPDPCDPSFPNNNCFETYDECRWWGDPHLLTFDGKWHHFQGEVYTNTNKQVYRYVSSCIDDNILPFSILAGHRKCPSSRYLCTWFLWIRLFDNNGNRIRTLTLWQNGITDSVIGAAPSNTPVYYGANSYYIWDASNRILYVHTGELCRGVYDFRIHANSGMTGINVFLNEYYKYLVCGLCGYWSDCIYDDFVLGPDYPDCQRLSTNIPVKMWQYTSDDWALVDEFGDSWGTNGRRRLQNGRNYRTFSEEEISNAVSVVKNLFPGNDDQFYENCAAECLVICEDLPELCVLGACQPNCKGPNCPDESVVEEFVEQFIPLPDYAPEESNEGPGDEFVPPF